MWPVYIINSGFFSMYIKMLIKYSPIGKNIVVHGLTDIFRQVSGHF